MDGTSKRVSGGHFVYTELKRKILSLEIEPGQRLYEPGLAKEFEVSRTPLREAVRRLISENLLEQQLTGGIVVPSLDAREIEELYDVRSALEALMAGEACRKATEEDLETMRGIVERNALLVTYADDAMNLGKSLHAKIAEVADNSWASRLHEQVANQMQRYRPFSNLTQARRNAALVGHRRIVEAIIARDPAAASQLAADHVIGARDEAIRVIGGQLASSNKPSPRTQAN